MRARLLTIGAYIITYPTWGVPYYNYSIIYPPKPILIIKAPILGPCPSQAVAFQVEQDGTVLDALTGEPCGMLEMPGSQGFGVLLN